MFRSSEIVFYF